LVSAVVIILQAVSLRHAPRKPRKKTAGDIILKGSEPQRKEKP